MQKEKNQRKIFLRQPKLFLRELIFETISWLAFGWFFLLGKGFLKTDIVDNVYQGIFGHKKGFVDFFLGREGKDSLLNYALCFIGAVILLKFISLLFNFYLWKKNKYIENNFFHLHQPSLFVLNSLIQLLCCLLLTFSFISVYTLIVILVFIFFNTWWQKKKSMKTEIFLAWQNRYVQRIMFFSLAVIFFLPFITSYLKNFIAKADTDTSGEMSKAFKEISGASPQLKNWINFFSKGSYVVHWIILTWWVTATVNRRVNDYNGFWKKISENGKQVDNLKHFYYYKYMLTKKQKKDFRLDSYNFLQIIPYFLRKKFLEKKVINSEKNLVNFEKEIHQTMNFLNFLEEKIPNEKKRNFLGYCLFNEFQEIKDVERTIQLIEEDGKFKQRLL